MNLICVDDEVLVLELTVSLCREILPEDAEVNGFFRVSDALDYVASNHVDIALLDIDMPVMNGLVLAARIKELQPDTAIIFQTSYSQYAVDAFSMHVSGYLLKPVSKEDLAREINYVSGGNSGGAGSSTTSHITAQTFGNFDLLVGGRAVAFARSKSKELLAYLVDRQGGSITRPEAAAVLWEDSYYDCSMQKQLDVVIRSLRSTLDEQGIGDLLELQRGSLRIRPEMLDCDLYRFFSGDIDAVNAYRGEYMISYSWAELTAAYMDQKRQNP